MPLPDESDDDAMPTLHARVAKGTDGDDGFERQVRRLISLSRLEPSGERTIGRPDLALGAAATTAAHAVSCAKVSQMIPDAGLDDDSVQKPAVDALWRRFEPWAIAVAVLWFAACAGVALPETNRTGTAVGVFCFLGLAVFSFPMTMALLAMRQSIWWGVIIGVLFLAACAAFAKESTPVFFVSIYTALYVASVLYWFRSRTKSQSLGVRSMRVTFSGNYVLLSAAILIAISAYVAMNRYQFVPNEKGVIVFDRWTGEKVGNAIR